MRILETVWYFIYHYIVEWHPCYIMYTKAMEYKALDMDKGGYLALGVFGIAVWFMLARFFAEAPGQKHGNMYFWWAFFGILHVWSIPFYVVYSAIASTKEDFYKGRMQRRYSDRSKREIYAESRQETRKSQRESNRRRR